MISAYYSGLPQVNINPAGRTSILFGIFMIQAMSKDLGILRETWGLLHFFQMIKIGHKHFLPYPFYLTRVVNKLQILNQYLMRKPRNGYD